jgi:hypothetical protein
MALLDMLDDVDNMAVQLAEYIAMLVSGLLLFNGGLTHILDPAAAQAAQWLTMVGLPVASPGLSLGGLVALFVMLVGALVLVNGLVLLWLAAKQFLGLLGLMD